MLPRRVRVEECDDFNRSRNLAAEYILPFAESTCIDITRNMGTDYRTFHGDTRVELNEHAFFKEEIPTRTTSAHPNAVEKFKTKWADLYHK